MRPAPVRSSQPSAQAFAVEQAFAEAQAPVRHERGRDCRSCGDGSPQFFCLQSPVRVLWMAIMKLSRILPPLNHWQVARRCCIALLLIAFSSGRSATAQSDHVTPAERLFTLQVLPLLEGRCGGCHQDDQEGGFRITDRDNLLRGGESGEPAIVPGKPDQGSILRAVRWMDLKMPPKEADRLHAEEITILEEWIAAGAPWPDVATQEAIRLADAMESQNERGIQLRTSGGLADSWTNRRYDPRDVWAFLPLQDLSDAVPANLSDVNAIDLLIDRQLRETGLAAAARATPRELIRRATLDLHGLLPTPDAVDSFEQAMAEAPEQAWADLIDDLLASPRYGEQWGRHWLDVTRYADTGGMSNDYERSNAWRYRDYVIRSFNEDKPWDQFIIEQLAGDELADASVLRRTRGQPADIEQVQVDGSYTPEESEQIIATGFLRLGPWDNAMVRDDEARQLWLDDVVNITGQAFLSQTMRCCRCHDHKFDPIPTRDYYRIYAAFSATHMAERAVPLLPQEDQSQFAEGRAHVETLLTYATDRKNELLEKQEAAARLWYEQHGLPYRSEEERKNDADEIKPPRFVGLSLAEQGRRKVREQDEWIWTRRLERYEPLAQSVYNSGPQTLAWNSARKLRINNRKRTPNPGSDFILLGGSLQASGDQVSPGVLSALPVQFENSSSDPWAIRSGLNGRRLDLARWIASPQNPLSTRSIVNRIWQHHFGTGICATANNFGVKGAFPTHPELLDFLAMRLVQQGWKSKPLHRMIMLSEAYQRGTLSPVPGVLSARDPDNQLLSVYPRRRLTSEQLRDSILMLTGELVHCTGGPPVMPEINSEVALQPRMIQFSLAPAWQPSARPELRNRRTIYTYHVRGLPDPFHAVFNQPDSAESCEIRESSTVTPQALTLLNSEQMTDRSLALAVRLQRESTGAPEQLLERAMRLIFQRSAAAEELQQLTVLLQESLEYHRRIVPAAKVFPTTLERSLVEEFTGEPFTYVEILPVFRNYTPDLKPAQASPETRALADVCMVLLNTNEFLFIE